MWLNVIFKNAAIFDCHLNDNDFVRRWAKMFKECNALVPTKHVYELTSQGMDQSDPFENLFDIIDLINKHKQDTIPYTYTRQSGRMHFSMKDLSEIHHIYEDIAKQKWDKSFVKDRDLLNDYIHQAEPYTKKDGQAAPRTRFRLVSPKTGVPNVDKISFEDSDYKLFTPWNMPYTLYLNYNAVGEDYVKAYKSKRGPKEAVPLKEYSPSFYIEFYAMSYIRQKNRITKIRNWMQEGGIDPDCPKESFGHIPLGVLFKDKPDKYYYNALTNSELMDVRFYD